MSSELRIKHTIVALSLLFLTYAAEAAMPLPWIEWDHSTEVEQTQAVPIAEAVFGPTTNATRCDQGTMPMTRLLFPPISGSFTRPNADETLYIYWYCDDTANAFVINRVLAIAAGNEILAVVPHQPMRYGGIVIQAVAAADFNGDGLMELVEEHSTMEYSAVHVYSINDTGTTRLSTVTTSLNSCDLEQASNWSIELAFSPDPRPGALAALTGKRTYHSCDYLDPLRLRSYEHLYHELATLKFHDPADYAVQLLSLAQLGYIDARKDLAQLYRDGDIMPRNNTMADWWNERANAPR